MLCVLASWCELVVDERGVAGPRTRAIEQLAAFLVSQLRWLAAHPAVADFAAEIAELVAAAQRVVAADASGGVELGMCTEPNCGQAVRAVSRAAGSARGQVSCDAGHTWQPHEWLLLGLEYGSYPAHAAAGREVAPGAGPGRGGAAVLPPRGAAAGAR
jgi:hypothetical protein